MSSLTVNDPPRVRTTGRLPQSGPVAARSLSGPEDRVGLEPTASGWKPEMFAVNTNDPTLPPIPSYLATPSPQQGIASHPNQGAPCGVAPDLEGEGGQSAGKVPCTSTASRNRTQYGEVWKLACAQHLLHVLG